MVPDSVPDSADMTVRRPGQRGVTWLYLGEHERQGANRESTVSILQLKEWMGHADIDTTMKYLHSAPRPGDADLVAEAFAAQAAGAELSGPGAL